MKASFISVIAVRIRLPWLRRMAWAAGLGLAVGAAGIAVWIHPWLQVRRLRLDLDSAAQRNAQAEFAREAGDRQRRVGERMAVLDAKAGVQLTGGAALAKIHALALSSGLVSGPRSVETDSAGQSLTMVLEGNYANLRRFLVGLDHLPFVALVEALHWQLNPNGSLHVTLDLLLPGPGGGGA
jgi:hypothetical protein